MINRKLTCGLLALLTAASLVTLAGCGDKGKSGSDKSQNTQTVDNNAPVAVTEAVLKTDFVLVPDGENVTMDELFDAHQVISNRLFCMNISEASVCIDEDQPRLKLTIPDKDLNDDVMAQLTRKGELTFRKGDSADDEIVMDGNLIKTAGIVYPDVIAGASSGIRLTLNDEGTEIFAALTEELSGSDTPISVWLDGEMLYAPRISAPITDGNVMITGDFTESEAVELVGMINAGALPFSLKAEKS